MRNIIAERYNLHKLCIVVANLYHSILIPFTIFTCLSIQTGNQPVVQTKKQMEPDKARTYYWLVDRIFKEEKVIVSNNATKEALTYIG